MSSENQKFLQEIDKAKEGHFLSGLTETMNVVSDFSLGITPEINIIIKGLTFGKPETSRSICFLAIDENSFPERLKIIESKLPNLDIDATAYTIFIMPRDSKQCLLDDLLKIQNSYPLGPSFLIGLFNIKKNIKVFRNKLDKNMDNWVTTEIFGELDSFFFINQHGSYFLGKLKSWGSWPSEIEALIDRSPIEEEPSPSGCSPFNRLW